MASIRKFVFTATITMGQLSFHDSTNVPSRQYKFTFTMKIKQGKTSAADRQIMDNKKRILEVVPHSLSMRSPSL